MAYKDKEKKNANSRAWNKANMDKCVAMDKVWVAANPEKSKNIRRNSNLKINHGITLEDYEQMLKAQGGRCAICGKKQGKKTLCVDHSHVTDKLRGLLCRECNTGIGMLGDDVGILLKAVEYLREHE